MSIVKSIENKLQVDGRNKISTLVLKSFTVHGISM